MFYATKIKVVSGDKAIDEQGKVLSFVGYLPVSAGDTVFTDGTVIFGCAKVKGGYGTIDEQPAVIPVLAEQKFNSNENLRGYFTKSGAYKKSNVAGQDWIANGKKLYAHDIDEGKIIDAEISCDENKKENGVFTVEKNIIQIGETENQYDDFVFIDNELIRDCEIVIKKDSEVQERINLSELSKKAEEFALAYVNIVEVPRQNPVNLVSTVASLKTFKVMPDGTWQALVDYIIYVKRQFRRRDATIKFKTTQTESYNKGVFPGDFPWGGDREDIANAFRKLGFSGVTTEIVLRDSAFAQSFYNVFYETMRPSYSERVITYSTNAAVEVSEEDTDKYYDTTAECQFLICFSSDGTAKKVYEESYCTPLIMDVTNCEGTINGEHIPNSEHIDATKSESNYPYIYYQHSSRIITGGYYLEILIFSFRGMAVIKRLTENTTTYCNVNSIVYRYDSRNLPNAPPYNQYFCSVDDNFFFPIQDDYSAKILPAYNSQGHYLVFLQGIYDSEGKALVGNPFPDRNNAYEWNMSIFPLRGNNLLFGIHDDSLYKLNPTGATSTIASGLKNFRLRELQNINKAKK